MFVLLLPFRHLNAKRHVLISPRFRLKDSLHFIVRVSCNNNNNQKKNDDGDDDDDDDDNSNSSSMLTKLNTVISFFTQENKLRIDLLSIQVKHDKMHSRPKEKQRREPCLRQKRQVAKRM